MYNGSTINGIASLQMKVFVLDVVVSPWLSSNAFEPHVATPQHHSSRPPDKKYKNYIVAVELNDVDASSRVALLTGITLGR